MKKYLGFFIVVLALIIAGSCFVQKDSVDKQFPEIPDSIETSSFYRNREYILFIGDTIVHYDNYGQLFEDTLVIKDIRPINYGYDIICDKDSFSLFYGKSHRLQSVNWYNRRWERVLGYSK